MKKRLFSKWFILPLITVTMISTFIVGRTWAYFNDQETSTGNTSTGWTSTPWTQTSQADFNAGVNTNVDTTTSPGDVQLPLTVTSPTPPAGDTGNWINGGNGYSSNNVYATYTPTVPIITNSPTANTPTAPSWTNPTRAYDNGGTGFAYITSVLSPTGNNVWGTYGFSLGTNVINKVRVRYDAYATASAITFQAAGANVKAVSGNVIPGLPSGWAANDIWLCLIESVDNIISTMPAGWTAIDAGTNNGASRVTLYYRRAVAGDTAPLVTHSAGSTITASIVGYRGCIATGSPFDVNQAVYGKIAASTTNNFGGGMTTTTNNDMIVLLSATRLQTTSATYTGAPTPTERLDAPNTTNYGELIVADFILATAGATGSRTSTLTTSRLNNGYQLSLKPDMPQIRVDVSWDGGTTWSLKQVTTLTQTKTTYWYDVTAATSWTPTSLNNTNFKVRVDAQTVGTPMVVNLDWVPVEVTYYDPSVWSHTYSTYGISLTGNYIQKVEAGFEAFAASSEKVQMEVTWNNGANWSAKQTSSALAASDPGTTTWFDFTSATTWTPAMLANGQFQVRIWYLNNGAFGQVSLDYLPVRITYRTATGTIASQVWDTTVTGSGWDGLAWDKTLPASTSITIWVRAQDISFAKADATPAWTSVGSTSPVISGLTTGRYKQWRATLTTTDTSTPTLSEVRLYYDGG